jgi:hypothetical protein
VRISGRIERKPQLSVASGRLSLLIHGASSGGPVHGGGKMTSVRFVINVEIVTNLLATALWELAIMPLYRGTVSGGRAARQLEKEVARAAADLADCDQSAQVPPTLWKDFFGSDEIRTLVQDLFMFKMDTEEPSVDEIRVAFTAVWRDVAERGGVPEAAVDIGGVFDQLVKSSDAVLGAAIREDVLAAHEAKAVARHRVVKARLDVIDQLLRRISDATPGASEYLSFEDQLRGEVALRYSTIQPPSLLGRERVDLQRLFVVPRLAVRDSDGSTESVKLADFVSSLRRRAVLGNPGAGKSTLAAKICYDLAQSDHRDVSSFSSLTPWMVELRRFAGTGGAARSSLVAYFTYWAETSYQLTVPCGAFEWLLSRGRLLVVFDGLDELLDTSLRQDVRNEVESFCRRYATAPVLVTSRLVGYDQAPLDTQTFDTVLLEDFDEPRVEEYTTKWFDIRLSEEPERDRKRHVADFMRDSAVAGELRNSPLLLALLVSLHRGPASIPNNLPDVYDSCANLLFSTWDKQRHIKVVLPFAEHVRPALRELAWWIFNSQRLSEGVTRRQTVERTADYLGRRRFGDPDKARAAAADFVDFCRGRAWVFADQGSTAAGEDLFGFTHRTFLEFFAAEHLAFRKQAAEALVEDLAPQIVNGQWDVVALIALQIKARGYPDGADDVVTALVDAVKPYRGGELVAGIRFVLRLLRAVIPSPKVTRRLGARLTLFVAREAYGRSGDAEKTALLDAMAGVGPEVREEFAAGVVIAERRLLQEPSPVRRQMGSQLMFRSAKALVGVNEEASRFWQDVGDSVVRDYQDDIHTVVGNDVVVALDAWPTVVNTRTLVASHGLSAVFQGRSTGFGGPAGDHPMRELLEAVTPSPLWTVLSGRAAWSELESLAECFVGSPLPWLRVSTTGLIALCAESVMRIARSCSGRLNNGTMNERFVIWSVSALALEELLMMTERSGESVEAEGRIRQLIDKLTKSRDGFVRELGAVLSARVSGTGQRACDVSKLKVDRTMSDIVIAWADGKERLISFVA